MAQLLFFLLQELRKKMRFEAKLFSVEKVKKKKPRTIQENFSVCAMRLNLKEKDTHCSPEKHLLAT